MGYVKWIFTIIGFMYGRFWGALMGYLIGSALVSLFDGAPSTMDGTYSQYQSKSPREGFLYSLMILSAHIIQADGKIMHSEMEYMRRFLRQKSGADTVQHREEIVKCSFNLRKQKG